MGESPEHVGQNEGDFGGSNPRAKVWGYLCLESSFISRTVRSVLAVSSFHDMSTMNQSFLSQLKETTQKRMI